MNIEITAYVHVEGDDEKADAEINRIAERFADVLAGRYGVERVDDQSHVRSIVVVKELPKRWGRLDEESFVGRMLHRGSAIFIPAKTKKEKTK